MKKLLALLLLSFIFCPTISMALTLTVNMDTSGSPNNTDADYATARDDATADTFTETHMAVGQKEDAGTETVYRTLMAFEMPEISGTVSAATFYFYADTDASDTNFEIYLVGGGTSKSTFAADDFSAFNGRVASGAHDGTILNNSWSTTNWDGGVPMSISFNAAGLDSIIAAQQDTLWLAMISKEDYDNSAPSGNEYVYIDDEGEGAHRPYISITSALPESGTTTIGVNDNDGYIMNGGVGYEETWILARDDTNGDGGTKYYVGVGWSEVDGGDDNQYQCNYWNVIGTIIETDVLNFRPDLSVIEVP